MERWKHEAQHAQVAEFPSPTHDYISLSPAELDVVGGYMVFLCKSQQVCSMSSIKSFVHLAFGVEVSSTWASNHAERLGFTSRRPASLPVKYARTANAPGDAQPF